MTDKPRFKGRISAFFVAFILSCVTVNALADTINIPAGAELLFATNFENTTFTESGVTKTEVTGNGGIFQGTDSSFAGQSYPTDWATFANLMGVNRSINAIGPTVSDGSAAIIDDPTSSGRGKVLRFRSTQLDTKTRVQVNSGLNGVNTFTSSVMVYIPSNIDTLSTYNDSVNWFTLGEYFFANDYSATFTNNCLQPPLYLQTTTCVPNYRVGLDLKKVGGQMVFALYGDYAGKIPTDAEKQRDGVLGAPTNGLTKTDWFTAYSTQEPLYDQWITLNLYYERYPNRTDGKGRMKLQMINSSGTATTLIDVADVVVTDFMTANRRYGVIKTNPMKLYTARYFIEHIFANSDPDVMLMYWDNWRMFRGDATVADGAPTTTLNPSKPTNLTLTKDGADIDLAWTAPTTFVQGGAVSGITGYDIRTGGQSTLTTAWTRFVTNQAGTTHTVTPGSLGMNCFQVRAVTASANGYWSDEVCLDTSIVAAPTGGSDPTLVDIYPFSNAAINSITTLNMTLGAAIPEGDLIVLCTAIRRGEELIFGGSYGLTSIAQVIGTHNAAAERDPNLRCYYKIAGASEPTTYTVNTDGTAVDKIHGIIAHFSNPDATPIRDFDTIIANQATSATLPALNGGLSNSVALAVGAVWDNQGTTDTAAVPSGYTEEVNDTVLSSTARFAVMLASVKAAADGTAAAATQTSAEASNHVGMHILISGLQIDTTPNAFTLTDTTGHQNNSPLGALNGACTAAISGLAADTTISISGSIGAEYNIDGGVYGSSPGTVGNGDVVCVRFSASDLYSSDETVTLNIGGVFADYIVTTLAAPGVQLKFADNYDGSGMNRDSRIYNPDGSLRNTQIDVIAIYSSPPMYKESSQIAPVIGYALNKTPALGVLTLSESDLLGYTTASLVAGQIVWIDMWNNDGSFKQTRKLRVIAE